MYPKHFMEQFWTGELNNKLFVAMSFHPSFASRFLDIIDPSAKDAGFACAYRADEGRDSNAITTKIIDGIANSRMVLCDLSDEVQGHVNGNVLYETGIAQAIREPHSVVLIRDQDPEEADFDVRGFKINRPPEGKLTKPWLVGILKDALGEIDWSRSKRIEAIAHSLDDGCLMLIDIFGRNPDNYNHFHLDTAQIELRLAAQRLVDLGILWFATARKVRPREHAYRWTSLAKDLMKYLGLPQLAFEEFQQNRSRWKAWEAAEKRYRESISK
jgi:hypothetical protein